MKLCINSFRQQTNWNLFALAGDDAGTGCSIWIDRDYPSGVGDYEITDAITNPTKANKYVVQAQRAGYTPRYNSPQEVLAALGQNVSYVVNSYVALGVGMYCKNDQNPNGGCMDYKARFCCGKLKFWNIIKNL